MITSTEPSPVVLVHGGWHTGDVWSDVASDLRGEGLDVYTPTLRMHGHEDDPSADVTLNEAVDQLQGFLSDKALTNVTLVGHSWSGMIITLLADRDPDRVRKLVYINAFIPENGKSLLDLCPPYYKERFDSDVAAQGHNEIRIDFETWRDVFIHDATAEEARRTYDLLVPMSYAQFTDPAELMNSRGSDIPIVYIAPQEDYNHAPGAWHPQFTKDLPDVRVITMPGSHMVMYTRPAELAQKISSAFSDR